MNKAQRTFAIMNYVKEHYAASNQPDSVFAAGASTALDFHIARASITTARANLGIPSNVPTRSESEVSRLRSLLLEMEGEFFAEGAPPGYQDLATRVRNALQEKP